ncbi:hypothetical protein [Kosakonia radicincitans]|uniref:hypothetical protein n=1 Tax=Kosakonia radicincitans TaxID=283686 RepID=UPI0005C2E8B3|nr:hypothetical protein [Kosakonia radicincitans]KIS41961.1 hypothetical protein LG58_2622 [Kosakonia radicincitans YD4]
MFKSWFTAPTNGGFSSFYYYNPATKEFCRIRLELQRSPLRQDDGRTGVFYRDNRVVGFSTNENLNFRNKRLWCIQKTESGDRLLYQGYYLLNSEPRVWEKYVYDSSDTLHSIHKGNPIIPAEKAVLPPGIRMDHLLRLAKVAIMRKQDIYLTSRDATPEHLARKILAEMNFPQMICDVVARI